LLSETDTLLAAIVPSDTNHASALHALALEDLKLSPYTPIELNLLIMSGRLKVTNLQTFTRALDRLLHSNTIEILPDQLRYHARAREIEEKYSLTFFDSLHGATALIEDGTICSFDREYDKLKIEGLRRIDPRNLNSP
jgi:predicted nucleic acid-binding protein